MVIIAPVRVEGLLCFLFAAGGLLAVLSGAGALLSTHKEAKPFLQVHKLEGSNKIVYCVYILLSIHIL